MTFGTPGQGQNPLAYSDRRLDNVPAIRLQRAPTEGDNIYPLMTHALDESSGDVWVLYDYLYKNRAQWQKIVESSATGDIMTLSDTSDVKTGPDATGNVKQYSSDGSISIATDAANFRQDYVLPDGKETATANIIVYGGGNFSSEYKADYATITEAVTAASAGDTIFIKEGSYTEDITVDKKLTFAAYGAASRTANVTITGTWTITADSSYLGLILDDDGVNPTFSISGAGIVINAQNCKFSANTNSAISMSNGGVRLRGCNSDGGKHFSVTGGTLECIGCYFNATSAASTVTAGSLRYYYSYMKGDITTSGTGGFLSYNSYVNGTLTLDGSGTHTIYNCSIISGANAAIDVDGTATAVNCVIESSNANPVTGAGTIQYADISFSSTGTGIDTSTQTIRKIGPNAEYSGTSHLTIPSGTTGEQPGTPAEGMLRGNTTSNIIEYYDGTSWVDLTSGGGGGLTWNNVTGTSQAMSVNNGYVTNNAGLVTCTLPASASVGDIIRVAGSGAGGWRIAQNAGQTINFLGSSTTTGATGRLDSTTQYDAVELVCGTANTDFTVISSSGSITVT
ncbi:MAG: hypothetical protein PQJ44_06960 [Sphaerochaetaceae bacterium]|nr:hypothetical protein [Sphaerochaetaceae bacterium]